MRYYAKKRRRLYAPIHGGLIDPKHIKNFGPSPLFMYIDLSIRETPDGWVSHGHIFDDKELASAYGQSGRTVQNWRDRLVKYGYIVAIRRPHGYQYKISKSRKFIPTCDRKGSSDQSDPVIGTLEYESDQVIGTLEYKNVRKSLKDKLDPNPRLNKQLSNKQNLELDGSENNEEVTPWDWFESPPKPKAIDSGSASVSPQPPLKNAELGDIVSSNSSDGEKVKRKVPRGDYVAPCVQVARELRRLRGEQ